MADADRRRGATGSRGVVWAALIGNVLVAVTKAGAALFTGSSAMLSEAVHSSVDTVNEVLLLYGMRVAKKKADRDHPAGYGRELYFWSSEVKSLFIKPQNPQQYKNTVRERFGESVAGATQTPVTS